MKRNRRTTLKQLISKHCANFFPNDDVTSNYCCMENNSDFKCVFFSEKYNKELPICTYLEKGVLPLDGELQAIYYKEREQGKELSAHEKKKTLKELDANTLKIICQKCNTEVSAKSNRQKYCSKCSKKIKRERQSKLMREKREQNKGIC